MVPLSTSAGRRGDHEADEPDGFDRGVTVSGGMRQRVLLAMALAGRPDLLIAELTRRDHGCADSRAARQRRVQLVFQDPSAALGRRQTVAGALTEALRLSGVGPGALTRRCAALLHRVGLTGEHGRRRSWQLSGGERQRAVIARSLVGDPDLLVLDEPFSTLDSVHRIEITDVLRALRDDGLAMVLISHDLGVVEQLADRLVVMAAGQIVEELQPGTRIDERSHPATHELAIACKYFHTRPLPDSAPALRRNDGPCRGQRDRILEPPFREG